MKSRTIFWIIAVVAVAAAVWYFRGSPEPAQEREQETTQTPGGNSGGNQIAPTDDQPEILGTEMKGELQRSNDPRRGNLMLLLDDSDRIIYLNTSRDYSQLVGKSVTVTIDGSIDDFRLVDIVSE